MCLVLCGFKRLLHLLFTIKVYLSSFIDQESTHPRSRSWEVATQTQVFGIITFYSSL